MRELFFTTVLLVAIFLAPKFAEAQRHYHYDNTSELRIRMYDNSMFVVILDRQKFENPTSLFRLSKVRPGNHRIVIKRKYGRYGSEQIVYRGNIHIPKRSIVKAKINRYNNLMINIITPIEGGNYVDPGYYRKPVLNMSRLRHSLNRANFDSDKQRIAEQAISRHSVKANQIYQILMLFSFESSKVKIAKFAYKHCVDKRNYYLVNDAFTFSSSVRALDNYIGTCRSDYYDNDWGHYNRDDYYGNNKW